jgi:hypothetical protein
MARRLIVDDLVSDVRSRLDEENTETLEDSRDILSALNRAYDMAANILARQYDAPLLAYTTIQLVGGTQEYDIPEDALEHRIERVEVNVNGVYYTVKRVDPREGVVFESPANVAIPYYWEVIGDKFRVLPSVSGTYPLRVWYNKDPLPLVKSQGMITSIGSNYVILTNEGEDLTAESDNLDSYVNIVDGRSGRLKATMQTQSIVNGKLTFKSTPARSTVLDLDVVGTIPATVTRDDYVCLVHGTCVPFMKKPLSNYLIQYAVAELSESLRGNGDYENALVKKFEDAVERSWVGRPASLQVTSESKVWARTGRRRRVLVNSPG